MSPLEPRISDSIGHDALRIWLDFWELTGRLRIDIIRRSQSGGNPAKMISADIASTIIAAVPAVIVARGDDSATDRAGEIQADHLRLEMMDPVHRTDRLRINGVEHEIDSIEERDVGDLVIWIVNAHEI